MVCRENKGRSAQMAIVKAFQSAYGDSFNDAEVQSLIHQVKHDGDALDNEAPLTTEEQIDMMRRLRAEVAQLDNISEAEKYRKSQQRPGVITRIDQEIARLETGVDEHGEKLTNAQKNSPAHVYAMQRLGQYLERVEPAKERFLETNARHRGISYAEAKTEWKELMNEKGHFESGSLVRDDVRESLATAGVTSEDQANLGASGRAVRAMEVMEDRRREAVSRLETRSAVDDSNKIATYVSSSSPQATIKCDTCGQFGHEASNCPNQAHQEKLDEISKDRRELNKYQDMLDRESLATAGTDEEIFAYDDSVDDVDGWRAETLQEVEAAKENDEYASAEYLERRYRRLEREQSRVEAKMAENQVAISDDVSAVHYNEDTGVLVVSRHNDADGNPRNPLVYRCGPEEAEDVADRLKTEPLDNVADAVLSGDEHKFANKGDEEAALNVSKCPSCGQWASMNSGHQCPVEGGPSEELEQERRRRRMEEQQARRRRRKEGGEDVSVLERREVIDNVRRNRVETAFRDREGNVHRQIANEGQWGKPAAVAQVVESGAVAIPYTRMAFSDGTVTGKASVWMDDEGNRMVSTFNTGMEGTGLKCDCVDYKNNGRCKHIAATSTRLAVAYGIPPRDGTPPQPARLVADGVLPGENINVRGRVAPDSLEIDQERPGMNRLLAIKNARRQEEIQQFIGNRAGGQGATTLMVEGPTDADGNPTDWPDTWSPQEVTDDGEPRKAQSLNKVTDLHDESAVADRFRLLMSNRRVKMPDGSTENIKFSATKRAHPGGITINLPKKYRNASPSRRRAAQKGLADILGVPEKAVTDKGVFIPSNPASYSEYLERAARNTKTARIRGPRTFAVSSEENIAASRRGRRPGETPNV